MHVEPRIVDFLGFTEDDWMKDRRKLSQYDSGPNFSKWVQKGVQNRPFRVYSENKRPRLAGPFE